MDAKSFKCHVMLRGAQLVDPINLIPITSSVPRSMTFLTFGTYVITLGHPKNIIDLSRLTRKICSEIFDRPTAQKTT